MSILFLKNSLLQLLLIAVIAAPISLLVTPRQAEAIAGAGDLVIVGGGVGSAADIATAGSTAETVIQATLGAAIQATIGELASADNFKEMVLDPIAWFAAKAVIRGITRSIVSWINSGFQGSPMFVTNPEAFLLDIIDREIGNFIYGTELGFLCSPFQLQIRIALATRYSRDTQVACRLTQIGQNLESFLNGVAGGFQAGGGWNTWFVVVSEENPYNRYLQTTQILDSRIARYIEDFNRAPLLELNWSSGFLSYKECRPVTESVRAGQVSERAAEATRSDISNNQRCETKTPGAFIEDQLANVAGSSIRQLELADEINEIIDALFSQLVVQAIGALGNGGLFGLSDSSNGPSYLDRLDSQTILPTSVSSSITESNPTIRQELRFKSAAETSLERVKQTETKLSAAPSCAAATVSNLLATKVTPKKTELEAKIASAEQNITALRSIESRLAAATSSSAINAINDERDALALHGVSDVANQELVRNQTLTEMTNIEGQVETESAACLAAEAAAAAAAAAQQQQQNGGSNFSTE